MKTRKGQKKPPFGRPIGEMHNSRLAWGSVRLKSPLFL